MRPEHIDPFIDGVKELRDTMLVGTTEVVENTHVRPYESIRPTDSMIIPVVGKDEIIHLRNETIPLYRLGQFLQIPEARDSPSEVLVVVLKSHGAKTSIMVDEVIDQ